MVQLLAHQIPGVLDLQKQAAGTQLAQQQVAANRLAMLQRQQAQQLRGQYLGGGDMQALNRLAALDPAAAIQLRKFKLGGGEPLVAGTGLDVQAANNQAQMYMRQGVPREEAIRRGISDVYGTQMQRDEYGNVITRGQLPQISPTARQAIQKVLDAPPQERPQIYQEELSNAASRGEDIQGLPQQYDANVENALNTIIQSQPPLSAQAPSFDIAETPKVRLARATTQAAEDVKYYNELYRGIQTKGRTANLDIAKYRQLDRLLDDVNTGKFTGLGLELKKAGKKFGVDLEAWGIADDTAPAEASRIIANTLALELRNPAGGAGMPGQMSDKDREFLMQSTPGLENTREGRKKMIEYRIRLFERAKEEAELARQYKKENRGQLDEGFEGMLAQYAENNPIFPEAPEIGGTRKVILFDAQGNIVE